MNIPVVIVVFIILGTIIGFFGRKFRFGFWGYFFLSVVLTPVVGFVALIAAIPKRPARTEKP